MQILFWVIATTMLAVALGFVAIPWLRGKRVIGVSHVVVAVLVPAIAFGLYAHIGSPQAMSDGIRPTPILAANALQKRRAKNVASVGNLVDGLRERLRLEPNDAGGWLLLARSYEHLGQYEDAAVAYQAAKDFGKTDVKLEEVLQLKRSNLHDKVSGTNPEIRGRVTMSPDAMSLVEPDDTIFIFAKQSRNDRMPIVALRKSIADLPIDFALTDRQVMVPGTRLADFESLVVAARVSKSGLATDSVAGLEVWSDPVSPHDNNDELLLNIDLQTKDANDD